MNTDNKTLTRPKKVKGLLRMSADLQVNKDQQSEISRYCMNEKDKDLKITDHDWIEIFVAGDQRTEHDKIERELTNLQAGDIILVSELVRLGRSLSEVFLIINKITSAGIILISVKENIRIDLNGNDNYSAFKIFSDLNNLRTRFAVQKNKERVAWAKSEKKKLGKPFDIIQASMYDPYQEKIIELLKLNVGFDAIVKIIGIGKSQSLINYINKRKHLWNLPNN